VANKRVYSPVNDDEEEEEEEEEEEVEVEVEEEEEEEEFFTKSKNNQISSIENDRSREQSALHAKNLINDNMAEISSDIGIRDYDEEESFNELYEQIHGVEREKDEF
jgi:hypothetical protein